MIEITVESLTAKLERAAALAEAAGDYSAGHPTRAAQRNIRTNEA